jgi:hypothetical protein
MQFQTVRVLTTVLGAIILMVLTVRRMVYQKIEGALLVEETRIRIGIIRPLVLEFPDLPMLLLGTRLLAVTSDYQIVNLFWMIMLSGH